MDDISGCSISSRGRLLATAVVAGLGFAMAPSAMAAVVWSDDFATDFGGFDERKPGSQTDSSVTWVEDTGGLFPSADGYIDFEALDDAAGDHQETSFSRATGWSANSAGDDGVRVFSFVFRETSASFNGDGGIRLFLSDSSQSYGNEGAGNHLTPELGGGEMGSATYVADHNYLVELVMNRSNGELTYDAGALLGQTVADDAYDLWLVDLATGVRALAIDDGTIEHGSGNNDWATGDSNGPYVGFRSFTNRSRQIFIDSAELRDDVANLYIPEPTALALLGPAVLAMSMRRRRATAQR